MPGLRAGAGKTVSNGDTADETETLI